MSTTSPTVQRHAGLPAAPASAFIVGGGWEGATLTLDNVVTYAADLLARAYGQDVTIRFNSDRRSGKAWLNLDRVDSIGANAHIGVGAQQTTQHDIDQARRRYPDTPELWQGRRPAIQVTYLVSASVAADPQQLAARPGYTEGVDTPYLLGGADEQVNPDSADAPTLLQAHVHAAIADVTQLAPADGLRDRLAAHRRRVAQRQRRALQGAAERRDLTVPEAKLLLACASARFGQTTDMDVSAARALTRRGLGDLRRGKLHITDPGRTLAWELRADARAAAR